MIKFSLVFLFLLTCNLSLLTAQSQKEKKQYKIVSVGFYNLENLFDTVDDTLINDEEFLPSGARAWTEERYS